MHRSTRHSQGYLRAIFSACVWAFAFVSALLFARYTLGTLYTPSDDEGYVLLSLKHFLDGEHLYTQVFTQYGPFYFLVQRALFHGLHLSVSHDSGRLITLIFWLLSASAASYFVYRAAGSVLLASAAGMATTLLAYVLAVEPNHPNQLILPLLLLACCVSLFATPGAMFVLGAIGTALLFTKINVGVLYLAALFQTLVCLLGRGWIRTAGLWLSGIYVTVFPLLLMHRDLSTWARYYCIVAILSGVSTLVVGSLVAPQMPTPKRMVVYGIAGAVTSALLIVIVAMAYGTPLKTILLGVFLDPLRHLGKFEFGADVSRRDAIEAFLITLFIAVLFWLRRHPQIYTYGVAALRCIIGLYSVWAILFQNGLQSKVMACLPLLLLPPAREQWRAEVYLPRLFVTILGAAQFLQSYPVAGSQRLIGASPVLLWAFLCIHDGAIGLLPLMERGTSGFIRHLTPQSILGTLTFLFLAAKLFCGGARHVGFPFPASALRGSHNLHLPPDEELLYEQLANNIHANCDVLFTMPGMGSLNLWSGVPTPNGLNLTAWVTELTPQQQQSILNLLKHDPRACAVYNSSLTHFWQETPQDIEASLLARYIVTEMPVAYVNRDYQLRVNPERTLPLVPTP